MPITRSKDKKGTRKEANSTPVLNETKPVTKDETNSTDEQTKKTVRKKEETTKQTEISSLPVGYENLKHPALVGVIKTLDALCKAPKPAKGKILQNEKFVSQFRDLQDILEGLTEQLKEPSEHETLKTKKRKQSGISAELESSKLRVQELEKENNELEASLKQFEEKNQKLHKQIEEATAEINKKTREYEEKLQQLTKLSKENGKLREITKNFEETIEAKNKKLESHSKDLIARSDFIKQQQKEYDALKNQLQQLQNESEKKNDQINELGTEIVKKKDEHDRICADFEKKNTELGTEIEKKTEEITALQDAIEKKNDELDELRNRLSAVSASRLDGDPSLTDLGDKNRPLKLVDRYQQLYDNLWTDVYDELLESYPDLDSSEQEKKAASEILSIFMNVKEFCEQTISKQENDIANSLLLCSGNSEVNDTDKNYESTIKELRKSQSDKTIPNVQKLYLSQLKNNISKTTKDFIEECVAVCWFCLVQDPPMDFEWSYEYETTFDKDVMREFTASGNSVDYVVWPTLRLHKGGPLMVKGVVQPIRKT